MDHSHVVYTKLIIKHVTYDLVKNDFNSSDIWGEVNKDNPNNQISVSWS